MCYTSILIKMYFSNVQHRYYLKKNVTKVHRRYFDSFTCMKNETIMYHIYLATKMKNKLEKHIKNYKTQENIYNI